MGVLARDRTVDVRLLDERQIVAPRQALVAIDSYGAAYVDALLVQRKIVAIGFALDDGPIIARNPLVNK